MHSTRTGLLMTAWVLCVVCGCSSSGHDSTQTNRVYQAEPSTAGGTGADKSGPSLQQILAAQGLTIVRQAQCRDPKTGKTATGYLATFDGKFTQGVNTAGAQVGPLPKYCLVLTGSSYCMGYEMGSLKPAETARMVNEYLFTVPGDMIGIKREYFPALFDFLLGEVRTLCENARASIPDYLEDEMAGIADGAQAQGYDVSVENVLLLNEGYDAIYSILFTGVLPSAQAFADQLSSSRSQLQAQNRLSDLDLLDQSVQITSDGVAFPKANPSVIGCNEFVVSNKASRAGAVYHGRDFMFSTGDMYQDYAGMIVYLPDQGYPFMVVSAPGFVGHPTLINSQGLSMGIDVVLGGCTRPTPGMGGLLVMRDIVQNCADLDQAIERMKAQDRGVSWLYILADDTRSARYTNGVVVEEGRSTPAFTGPDVMPSVNRWLFDPWVKLLEPAPLPDKGLMFRNQAWEYPDAFTGVDLGYPGTLTYMLYFPDQRENWDDVVMCTNHYIIPRMVFTSFTPLIALNGGGDLNSSITRYDIMHDQISQAYGDISFQTTADLIDFLNPNRGLDPKKRYTIGGPVQGHHAAIDNGARVIKTLYGYYGDWQNGVSDTWVQLDLKPFLQ